MNPSIFDEDDDDDTIVYVGDLLLSFCLKRVETSTICS